MNALYNEDRSIISEEELEIVNTEYIDTAGLYDNDEFDKVTYIHYLNHRVNWIRLSIRLQRDFIEEFDVPYIPELEKFSKYGHKLYWDKDIEKFLKVLNRIEDKEQKYIDDLEASSKQLIDLRKLKNKEIKPETTKKQSRGSFVRTLNSLGKLNWKIDSDKTTVEELAYIIKQQSEDNQYLRNG